MTKDTSTEKKILEAAREVFVQQGMKGARMQEIADRAGINKALLHYYFRSKDALFEKVFLETLQVNAPVLYGVMGKDIPLKQKLEEFTALYIEIMRQNPFMPLFIINEISQNPDKMLGKIGPHASAVVGKLKQQLVAEAENGNIRQVEPVDLVSAIMGLCIFPVLAKPILQPVFSLDAAAYNAFLDRRKVEAPKMIWNYLTSEL